MKKRKQTGEEMAFNRRISQKDSMALGSSTEFPRRLEVSRGYSSRLGKVPWAPSPYKLQTLMKSDVSSRVGCFNIRLLYLSLLHPPGTSLG